MSVLLSLEKGKFFSAPYEELFFMCEKALCSLGLEINRLDQSSGIIEARRRSTWPFKSKEQISLIVRRDSRVVAVAKIDMNKAMSSDNLIIDRFFTALSALMHSTAEEPPE
jgi:hypothetical protein